jgi:hypothetical protein
VNRTTKTILISIIAILLVWSISASVLWVKESRESRNNTLQQIRDFHESLINLKITTDHLLEIVSAARENNSLDPDPEFLALAVHGTRSGLERTAARISMIEARIDPRKDNFSQDYSIQELLGMIHKIHESAGEILGNTPVDPERLDRLNEMLESSKAGLGFVYSLPIDSVDFRNQLKQYIDSMNTFLDKV